MASINGGSGEKTYFEQQRELLVSDVAASLENVLQNINKLNRSLEGVIAVRLVIKKSFGRPLADSRRLAMNSVKSKDSGLNSRM